MAYILRLCVLCHVQMYINGCEEFAVGWDAYGYFPTWAANFTASTTNVGIVFVKLIHLYFYFLRGVK